MSIFRSLMAQQRSQLPTTSFGGYVTDGLIFMIDAIWNDAVNTSQNQQLSGIRDLVSGAMIPFGHSSYKYKYIDNALHIDSGNKNTTHSVMFDSCIDLVNMPGFTVEQVDAPMEWEFSDGYTIQQSPISNSVFSYGIVDKIKSSDYSMPTDVVRVGFVSPGMVGYTRNYVAILSNLYKRHMSCSMTSPVASDPYGMKPDNIASLIINGINIDSFIRSNAYSDLSSPLESTLKITIGSNSRMNMRLYSYRIYNRALTPAEQAQNYAIDRRRFSL